MDPKEIIKPENKVYARPRLLTENITHYCPGCSHGVVHRLVAELLDELGLDEDEIINAKMAKNEAKYPVELAKGSAEKYTELKKRSGQ